MKHKRRKQTKQGYVRSIYRRNGGVSAFIASSVAVIAGIEHDISVTGALVAVIAFTAIILWFTGITGIDEFEDRYRDYVKDYEERNKQ